MRFFNVALHAYQAVVDADELLVQAGEETHTWRFDTEATRRVTSGAAEVKPAADVVKLPFGFTIDEGEVESALSVPKAGEDPDAADSTSEDTDMDEVEARLDEEDEEEDPEEAPLPPPPTPPPPLPPPVEAPAGRFAEYENARSSRSKCGVCEAPIVAGTPRFSYRFRATTSLRDTKWVHLVCLGRLPEGNLVGDLRQLKGWADGAAAEGDPMWDVLQRAYSNRQGAAAAAASSSGWRN